MDFLGISELVADPELQSLLSHWEFVQDFLVLFLPLLISVLSLTSVVKSPSVSWWELVGDSKDFPLFSVFIYLVICLFIYLFYIPPSLLSSQFSLWPIDVSSSFPHCRLSCTSSVHPRLYQSTLCFSIGSIPLCTTLFQTTSMGSFSYSVLLSYSSSCPSRRNDFDFIPGSSKYLKYILLTYHNCSGETALSVISLHNNGNWDSRSGK